MLSRALVLLALAFPGVSLGATGQSVGKTANPSVSGNASASVVTATGSTTARPLKDRFADVVNVKDFGAKGDGSTNDTAAIAAARATLTSKGGTLFFPCGTYVTDPIDPEIAGLRIIGSGQQCTALISRTGQTIIDVPNGRASVADRIEIAHLKLYGAGLSGNSGNGIHFGKSTLGYGDYALSIHHVTIANVGGRCVHMEGEWSTTLQDVDCTSAGGNHFELSGGNTVQLIRPYAHNVKAGYAGYRIHGGQVTLIGANGIDSGSDDTNADWGVFGDTLSDGDAQDAVAKVTMIGCNVEDFTRYGIRLKTTVSLGVSTVRLTGTKFNGPGITNGGATIALKFDGDPGPGQEIDDTNIFYLGASNAWVNGYAVHTAGYVQPLSKGRVTGLWDGHFNYTWDDLNSAARAIPTISLNGTNNAINVYPLSVARLDQPDNSILSYVRRNTATWNPGTIGAGASATTTVTTTYVPLADSATVTAGFSNALPAGVEIVGKMTATNTATVTIYNWSGSPVTIPSGTVRVLIFD